jgi:hypothetical protein
VKSAQAPAVQVHSPYLLLQSLSLVSVVQDTAVPVQGSKVPMSWLTWAAAPSQPPFKYQRFNESDVVGQPASTPAETAASGRPKAIVRRHAA